MFGMIYVYLPLMVLPLYASMEKLDFRLVEAGYDLYATRLRVLWHIIIPLVRPASSPAPSSSSSPRWAPMSFRACSGAART